MTAGLAGFGRMWLEESPDTAGQDARAASLGTLNGATEAAKADGKWNRKETAGSGDRAGKGETVG